MTALLCFFLPCLPGPTAPSVRLTGVATVYRAGDGHTEGRFFGCHKEAKRLLGSARFREDLPTVAMRHVRCGKVVRISKGARRTLALVLDRGPFGCRWPDGSRTVEPRGKCEEAGGKRIAVIDLGRVVARALEATGFDRVRISW